jgi:hypothetical protein
MLPFQAEDSVNGKRIAGIGLTAIDIFRLVKGIPIDVEIKDQLMIGHITRILIVAGETEEKIKYALEKGNKSIISSN